MTSLSSLPPDSSSSDSSPSLPFDPFSRLPTELVQHIVESTIPFGYYSSTYSERQRTLRSLCLVSRLFHQVAESILHEVVHVDRKKEFEVWRSAARLGRSTSLQSLISGLVPPNKVLPLLSGSPKLRMLVIGCNGGEVDVGLMSGLSGKHFETSKLFSSTSHDFRVCSFDITPPRPRQHHHLSRMHASCVDRVASQRSDIRRRNRRDLQSFIRTQSSSNGPSQKSNPVEIGRQTTGPSRQSTRCHLSRPQSNGRHFNRSSHKNRFQDLV